MELGGGAMKTRLKRYYRKLVDIFTLEGKPMEHKFMRYFLLATGLFTMMLLGALGCSPAPTSSPTTESEYTVMTASNTALGTYLVDGSGRTLYYFTKDSAEKSTAGEAIILVWPIFYKSDLKVSEDLNAADFGTITRDDGKAQTTYKGWPLYYYAPDTAPGDTRGQGIGGVWFVVNPSTTPAAP